MSNFLTKILGDKKEWKAMEDTGEDVDAFCHEHLRGTTSYLDKWRASLNRDVAKKHAE